MNEPVQPIRPELLAAKMEKIENFEQPRLLEEFTADARLVRALWFLQWVSQPQNYPGGLSKFAADLTDASVDLIGTAHMTNVRASDKFSRKDAIAIFRELPDCERYDLFGSNDSVFVNAFFTEAERWDDYAPESTESRKDCEALLVAKMTPALLRSRLSDIARRRLAEYFKQLCELPHVGFRRPDLDRDRGHGAPWYFGNIAEALLAFMDARADQLRSRLAETEVTKEIRRWIGKSRSMCRAVMFVGNSRFGKTEAIKLEARAEPGNCRLVNTPASNAISDLLREVAKTLGIEVGPQSAGRELRERIDYVLRFSKLQLIFDESQFLLPGNYSRNTAPARLNWVRRSVIDQDTAAIFVCTPQSYLPAKRRFVKATGFVMEQFDERVLTRELPCELSEADLLAVARVHFADLEEEYLRFVVDTVLATERNFVSDVEKIATLANDNAREHGRARPKMVDIEAAIADVLPTIEQPAAPPKQPQKAAIRRVRKHPAEPLQSPRRGLETLGRDRSRPLEVTV